MNQIEQQSAGFAAEAAPMQFKPNPMEQTPGMTRALLNAGLSLARQHYSIPDTNDHLPTKGSAACIDSSAVLDKTAGAPISVHQRMNLWHLP